jgi:AraC-like DNA-binding protein
LYPCAASRAGLPRGGWLPSPDRELLEQQIRWSGWAREELNLRPLPCQEHREPLRIAEAARAVNMSPSRFAHVFKERTGLSPHQFRKQLRLEHARHMVEEQGWSVSTVAAEVGYVNISHFINEFRKLFGRTPGSYLPLKKGS